MLIFQIPMQNFLWTHEIFEFGMQDLKKGYLHF